MKNKTLKFTFKVIISLAFLYWVVIKTNWPEVLFYLKRMNAFILVVYVLFLILGMAICSYRWKILAEFKGIRLSLKDFLKLYIAGTFINNFMPSFIAGDAYKAYEIAGPKKKYAGAASSVMMDRITGLIGAMILALIFSFINLKIVLENKLLLVINIGILLSLGSDFLIARLRKIKWLKNWVMKIMPDKIIGFLRELYSYNNSSKVLSKSIWLSVAFSFIGVALINYILFWGLGIKIGIIDYLSVIFLISIVSALPITINNIGLKEWAYVTFFGIFGVGSGAVVAVSVISRFIQMAVSFYALPDYLRNKK